MTPSITPLLPFGAREIWDMRVGGKKPSTPVFVTMVGPITGGPFVVTVPEGRSVADYDWRWVRDLCVCVVSGNDTNTAALRGLLQHILRRAPSGGIGSPVSPAVGTVWSWNADRQDGTITNWWAGHAGVAELDISAQPEQFSERVMAPYERAAFMGVTRA